MSQKGAGKSKHNANESELLAGSQVQQEEQVGDRN